MKKLRQQFVFALISLLIVVFIVLGIVIGSTFKSVLSVPIENINETLQQIWLFIFIIFSVAFIIILYIGTKITSRFVKPVESATKVAMELAKGNYRVRALTEEIGEAGQLSTSINILAQNLQKITKEQEMQTDQLMTIIENMGSGLILIDDKGYLVLTNRTYKDIFHQKDEELIGFSYSDVIRYQEVRDLIDKVFMTEQNIRKQISISIGIQMKSFEIYGAPIISYHNEWKGIVVVFHDISELKKLEQIRKDFVANVSHEIKTPITSIRGFAETLLDGAMNDREALQSFLEIILKESERLQSLIHDLLELSKIEKVGFTLDIEKVQLEHILDEIIEILRKKAEGKQITITKKTEGNDLIEGDSFRIEQIFINLLSNAIAYTPDYGNIDILIEEKNEQVAVSVRDTGIGIAKEEIPRLFERFYRVDKARSRNSGGTGLGLAIVKHIVEAHGGSIDVESELGKGSTFTILFNKEIRMID